MEGSCANSTVAWKYCVITWISQIVTEWLPVGLGYMRNVRWIYQCVWSSCLLNHPSFVGWWKQPKLKVLLSNPCYFKQDRRYSLITIVHECQYESSSQTESKKGYLFLHSLIFVFHIVTINAVWWRYYSLGLSSLSSLPLHVVNVINTYTLNGLLACFLTN